MLYYKHRIQIEIYALANYTFNMLICHCVTFWMGGHTRFIAVYVSTVWIVCLTLPAILPAIDLSPASIAITAEEL